MAVEGDEVPVYSQGKVIGHKTRKSESLLMFMIKTLRERCEKLERQRLVRRTEDRYEGDWNDFSSGDLSIEQLANPRAARSGKGTSEHPADTSIES